MLNDLFIRALLFVLSMAFQPVLGCIAIKGNAVMLGSPPLDNLAVLQVDLIDASIADAPSRLVKSKVISVSSENIEFEFCVDSGVNLARYYIQAKLKSTETERVLFMTTEAYPVKSREDIHIIKLRLINH